MMLWRPNACHQKQYTAIICVYSFIQCSSVIWLSSLFRISSTKPYCDGLRRGQQLLQWLWGQRDYCVTLKSSGKLTQRSVASSMKCVAPGEPYDWPNNWTLITSKNTETESLYECKMDINVDYTTNEVIHFMPKRTVGFLHTWLREWPVSSLLWDKCWAGVSAHVLCCTP